MKSFRAWVADLYRENCDERDQFGQPRYLLQEYFRRYRWWLKREYQYQQGIKRGS